MNEQRLPFYRRIFFKLLVPVILVGLASSTLIVSYMSAPLEHFLVRQFDANLRLSSVMALRICEESFNYLLDLRLEANHEMNQVLRNEAKEKITSISKHFPHIHLLIVQAKTEIKACSLRGSPTSYEQAIANVNDDSKLSFFYNSKKVTAHAQYFPFWDWHLVGFVYEDDYKRPVKLAHSITYLCAAAVFLTMVVTLLLGFGYFVKAPLSKLIVATDGVKEGRFQKIVNIEANEFGQLMSSFNEMVTSLEREKAAVQGLIGKLKESEALFRSQFEFGSIGIVIFKPDKTVIRANQRLCDMLEYTEDELHEAGLSSFYVHSDRTLHDEYFSSMLAGAVNTYELDCVMISKSGKEVMTHMNVSSFRNVEGVVELVIASIIDITERKLAEEELKKVNDKLKAMVNVSPAGIALYDLAGRVLIWNPAAEEMLGWKSAEVVDKESAALPQELAKHTKDLIEELNKGKSLVSFETQRKSKDGSLVDILHSAASIKTVSNEVYAFVDIMVDVSESRRIEQEKAELEHQLLQSQKLEAVGQLAGGVAHDLNNLLSPIIGYSEMLIVDAPETDPRVDDLKQINKAGKGARDIVRQLLAFSRKQTLEYKPIDINTVLDGFQKLLRRTIRENIEIDVLKSPDIKLIMADVGQVEQVIINLAINAADAMPEGGKLTITTTMTTIDEHCPLKRAEIEEGEYVLLTINDTGNGMDEKTRQRVFEPFFSTKGVLGTGLGLATVYGIVKQHKGSIIVHSVLGEGSTFYIYFPLSEDQVTTVDVIDEFPSNLKGKEKVLISEDDETVRGLALAVLKKYGYEVHVAQNGHQALKEFQKNDGDFDLLITDVIMPDMNGKILYAKLKEKYPSLKVLYISGYTDDVIAHHGVLDEGLNFLQKPFSIVDLAAKVRQILDT